MTPLGRARSARSRSRSRRSALARRILAAAAVAAVVCAAASCSLGLDEGLIGQGPGGVENDGSLPDGVLPDGALPDGQLPPTPGAEICTKDEDCGSEHGCLKGRCDLSRKACVFDVCRAACSAAACDAPAQKCGAQKPYKYAAAQFPVGTTVGARRAAAVHPYLFLGTPGGVLAFNVSNPSNAAPPQVPVVGLGFVPAQVIASGNRVYFLAAPQGSAPARLPLAWIDVPADPFLAKLEVKTVLATYNRPATDEGAPTMFPRVDDTALIVGAAAASHPSVLLQAPLVEPLKLDPLPLTFTQNTVPVAASGKRLVMRGATNNIWSFGLIANAGEANAQNLGDTTMADAGMVGAVEQYAQSPDGAFFWATETLQPPNPESFIRSLRAYFVLADGNANVDQAAGVDVEIYNLQNLTAGQAPLAPVAMLDGNSAILAHAARENLQQTAVQFVTRKPLGVVKNADKQPRRIVLPIAPGTVVAAAGSNGIGYLVANVDGPPPNAIVYVFDPACAP